MLRRACLVAACLTLAAAGCGGSRTPGASIGPGGHHFDWPPPASVVSGAPTQSRFCALMEDDLEHLASTQQAIPGGGLRTVVPLYLTLIPGLESAAPPAIAPEVKAYYGNISSVLKLVEQYGYDYLKIPGPQLQSLNSPSANSAASAVTNYSIQKCHFDMSSAVARQP